MMIYVGEKKFKKKTLFLGVLLMGFTPVKNLCLLLMFGASCGCQQSGGVT
jgi:hypothetical protein